MSEAHTCRLLGEVAIRHAPPDIDQAVHYCQALALVEELGLRPLQGHCPLGLDTRYARIGQLQQAQAALCAAITLYRAMEMTFWLPQARRHWRKWRRGQGEKKPCKLYYNLKALRATAWRVLVDAGQCKTVMATRFI